VLILGEPVNHPQKTVKHLCIADLFIDGNRRNQQRELWRLAGEGSAIRNNGITVQRVSDSTVENVTCADCRSGGLVTTLGVKRLAVRGLTSFDNQFDGLACYLTTHSTFSDLYLHDNPGAGISLDLAFNDNIISNAFLAGNDLGIFMRASRDNQFHNITIQNSRHFGVFMAQADQFTSDGPRPAPESECTQNAFTNLIARHCGSADFRVNNITCINNTIIRPQFDRSLKGAISQAEPNLITVE
jgi:Periplasmic copper-binding protein (NosD)